MASEHIKVVVGVVQRGDRVLVARRPAGVHLGGLWEFPGGKQEDGETSRETLERELHEEVGLAVEKARCWMQLCHRYPERTVELDVWRVQCSAGAPGGTSRVLRWVLPGELLKMEIPQANRPIADALLKG